MRNSFYLFLLFLVSLSSCAKEEDDGTYGSYKTYAFGLLGSYPVSFSGNYATVAVDFVIYNQQYLLDTNQFKVSLGVVTSGTTVIKHTFKNIVKREINNQKNCNNILLLNENNPIERSDRLEIASRNIIDNLNNCDKLLYGFYPSRDEKNNVKGKIHIAGNQFTNASNAYDQLIARIGHNAYKMYEDDAMPYANLHTALDSALKFSVWNPSENNHIVCLYENRNGKGGPSAQQLASLAKQKNIQIHAIKDFNFFPKLDSIVFVTRETGGVLFGMDFYDPFVSEFDSDAVVASKNIQKIISNQYQFYTAYFQVNMTNRLFSSGFWYYMPLIINLPDEDKREILVHFKF